MNCWSGRIRVEIMNVYLCFCALHLILLGKIHKVVIYCSILLHCLDLISRLLLPSMCNFHEYQPFFLSLLSTYFGLIGHHQCTSLCLRELLLCFLQNCLWLFVLVTCFGNVGLLISLYLANSQAVCSPTRKVQKYPNLPNTEPNENIETNRTINRTSA
jgi:hypothetical protein